MAFQCHFMLIESLIASSLQILLIVASVVGVIVYRLAMFLTFSAKLRSASKELEPFKEYVTPQMATSITASIISFIIIMILNNVYEKVAIWITDFGKSPVISLVKVFSKSSM